MRRACTTAPRPAMNGSAGLGRADRTTLPVPSPSSPLPSPPSPLAGGPPPLTSASPPFSLPSYVPSHLSPSSVAALLAAAQSPDAAQRQAAQARMAECAGQVGYRTSLAWLALSAGVVAEEVRLLALIELKNRLDAFFAASASPLWQMAGAGDEREGLKAALLERMGGGQ